MHDLAERIASLSAEERALLELMLAEDEIRSPAPQISRRATETAPLSFAQERLWFLEQLVPGTPLYTMPGALQLSGPLDQGVLRQSLNALVGRHEALRTSFGTVNDQPIQQVRKALDLALPVLDLTALPASDRPAALQQRIAIEAGTLFDLAHGPLIRTTLVRLAPDDHVLLVTLHHLIADGWSLGILLHDLTVLYTASLQGRPAPLAELALQYADFAAWQREWLDEAMLEQLLGYWRKQLHEPLPLLTLPTDRPRAAELSFAGAQHPLALPRSLTDALVRLSAQEQSTLFMTLLAAFDVLLHRYSGQTDIIVGTPVANRNQEGVQHTLGCFVNLLALRTDLSGSLSFRELLRRVRAVALDAYAHQDLPFEKLVENLRPARHQGYAALFQVMFILHSASAAPLAIPDLTIKHLAVDNGTAKFDLTFSLAEDPTGLQGWIEYNTDLFDTATIQRMAGHFQTLLEGITNDPDCRVSALPLLSEAELRQLQSWNATAVPYPPELLLHQLFAAQVERTPDAVALLFEDQQLTYAALDVRANQLAHHLQSLGVGPDTLVAVALERSLDLVVALLGTLKAGGAYLPLDPSYPHERLTFMLTDSQAAVLLTSKEIGDWRLEIDAAQRSPISNLQSPIMVDLEADWPTIARQPATNSDSAVTPENLAYVIYTSGSTGVPKGAMNTHQAIVNRLLWMQERYGLSGDDLVMQKTPFSFDVSVWEFFWPLLAGARLVLARPEGHRDPVYLAELIERTRITTLHFVPSMLRAFLEGADVSGCASLRRVICSGEALPYELQQRFFTTLSAELHNLYGPTEAAVDVSAWACRRELDTSSVPIGHPIANTELYILDRHMHTMPIGVPGELYIGGVQLARGYHRRPDLTAERFIPNPFVERGGEGERGRGGDGRNPPSPPLLFSPSPPLSFGGRLYRTGDLCRYRPDGAIEFLGRIDGQVKLRGFRIELGEIEATLTQHEAVQEAVVLAREEVPGDKRLVAYIVSCPLSVVSGQLQRTTDNGQLTSELRAFLKQRLPVYMIPSAFVLLDAMPLSPNGKVDRRGLPAPSQSGWDRSGTYEAPRTPAEELVAGVWAEVLGISPIGIHDNFFELGGHSLLATRVVSQLREIFQVEVPLRKLFEAPTVAGLAMTIGRQKAQQTEQPAPLAQLPTIIPAPAQRGLPFPLNDVQQAYWIGRSDMLALGNIACHGYVEVECIDLDLPRLNQAWQRLIERHDMLRAVVHPDGQQQILPAVPFYAIDVVDLRSSPQDTLEDRLAAIRQRMSHQVLACDRWPLFEIRAAHLNGGRCRLFASMDLLISDAWSFSVLLQELRQLFQDLDALLPPLELSFRDYVLAEKALQDSELYHRSLAYWRRRLPTLAPAPELPLAKDPATIQQPHFVRRSARLPADAWSRLKRRAAQAGLTPSGVLLAAYAEILTAWSKHPRLTINLTLFNRLPLHPQVQDILGDFTSITLLEVDNSTPECFEVRARRLQEQLWEDLDHRYVSGVQVQRELMRRQGTASLMPVVFTSTLTLGTADAQTSLAWLGEMVYTIGQTPQVWLDHVVSEEAGGLLFNWDTVEGLFPDGMVDDMFAAYSRLLHRLIEDESTWHEMVLSLARPEHYERLAAINATQAPIPADLLFSPFVAQAAQQPDRPAVISTRRTLTYQELYRRANQIGRRLRELGARPNTLVAIVMEKGWEQVAAALGILQAGAAYVPIDAALPAERLRYLLQHGQVDLALTQPWLARALDWPPELRLLIVDEDVLEHVDDRPLAPVQGPEDVAYVIYTSGSTGLPKGVVIDHRGALNTIVDLNQRFGVTSDDRVLALSALSFDLSVYDIFGVLAAGGAVVMPDPAARREPAHWMELVARERVTIWNTVPALMGMLAEYVRGRGEQLPDTLRLVMMSGDWIPVGLPDQIRALARGAQIYSLGGATEASIWSIFYPITQVDPDWPSIPYGWPLLNQTFYVLDHMLAPRPAWVPGALYIGGIGLAKGYWGDEEKTQASFITHPRTGERLYRTGDLGRYLPDGTIEFLGREDFQVKIQGYRIELGEIEATLAQHPSVQAAVVAAHGEGHGAKRLVGYVVPSQEPRTKNQEPGDPTEGSQFSVLGSGEGSQFSILNSQFSGELRAYLKERLPEYMVPTTFVMLDALPLTDNGKVNRRALPAPERIGSAEGAEAPRTPVERTLADMCGQVLGIARTGNHDNFFELGGNSVQATQLVALIREAFQIEFPLRSIFEAPSVARLAEKIEASRWVQQPARKPLAASAPAREEGEL